MTGPTFVNPRTCPHKSRQKTCLTAEEEEINRKIREKIPIACTSFSEEGTDYFASHVSLSETGGTCTKAISYETYSLRDSGASASCVNLNLITKLAKQKPLFLEQSNAVLEAANKSKQLVAGKIWLYLTLKSQSGLPITIRHNFYVIQNLAHEVILGNDIIKKHEVYTDGKFAYYSLRKKEATALPPTTTLGELTTDCHKLPFISSKKLNMTNPIITVAEPIIIPPKSARVVQGRISNKKARASLTNNVVQVTKHPKAPWSVKIFDAYSILDDSPTIHVPVSNKSTDPLLLDLHTAIAIIQPLDITKSGNTLEISAVDVTNNVWTPSQKHVTRLFYKKLDLHNITDENERRRLLQEYLTTGKADIPADGTSDKGLETIEPQQQPERTAEELVQAVDINHVPKQLRPKLINIFRKYSKVFQRHKLHFNITENFEAEVETKPITKPVYQPFRPVPEEQTSRAMKMIDAMVEAGVMKKSTERAWIISQFLVVKKPKSNDLRLLCDLRQLNYLTVQRQTDIITQDEVMAKVAKANYVSTLDLSNAYHSIPIKKEHQHLFTFLAPNRQLYTYTTLPQGWTSSASYLNDFLRHIFRDLPFCIIFMDDILVAGGKTPEEHINWLELVFQTLAENNLLVKPEKLQILQQEIEFLGVIYNVTSAMKTVSIPQKRVQGYLSMKRPSTRKGLLSFLCSLSFFRRLIPRYAERSYNLHKEALPRKPDKGLIWTESLIDDYNNLLKAVEQHGTITCPDHKRPFVCFSDASQTACSFLVFQPHPETSKLMLVSCISKSFSKSEQSQHIFYKEMLAITHGLEAFGYFLKYAEDILIYTDARGIALTRIAKNSSPALVRKLFFLSSFQLTLKHIPGEYNAVADHLSRYNRISPAENKDEQKGISMKHAIDLTEKLFLKGKTFTHEDIRDMLKDDLKPIPSPVKAARKTASKGTAIIQQKQLIAAPKAERKIKMPRVRVQKGFDASKAPSLPESKGPGTEHAGTPVQANKPSLQIEADPSVTQYIKTLKSANRFTKNPDDWLNQVGKETLPDVPTDMPLCTVIITDKDVTFDNSLTPNDEILGNADVNHLLNPSEPVYIPGNKLSLNSMGLNPPKLYGDSSKEIDTIPVENPETSCCSNEEQNEHCDHEKRFTTLEILASIPHKNCLSPAEFRKCQTNDPRIRSALKSHSQGQTKKFVIAKGILCLKGKPGKTHRPYIPKILIEQLTHLHHFTALGNHRAPTAIVNTINKTYYNPDLKQIVTKYVKQCALCCIVKRSNLPNPENGTFRHPNSARCDYAMDLAPNLGTTKQGNNHALVIIDLFSSMIRVIPIKTKTPEEIIQGVRLIQTMDTTRINSLRMDGERAASSEVFENFCKENGIIFEKTAQNRPQANGRAEKAIDDVKTSLKCLAQALPADWDTHLDLVSFSNAKVVNSSGYTPEELHYGNTAPSPLTLLNIDQPLSPRAARQIKRQLKQKRDSDLVNRQARNAERKAYRKQFKPGDIVVVKITNAQRDGPLGIKYKGPYVIDSIERDSLSVSLKSTRSHHSRTCDVTQLKHWPKDPKNVITERTALPKINATTE